MAKEFTIEDLRVLADLAGLNLSDDDLQRPAARRQTGSTTGSLCCALSSRLEMSRPESLSHRTAIENEYRHKIQ
mgnify:CR=1 FL=1